MATVQHKSYDKSVGTIADRNALTPRPPGMMVMVQDAVGDPYAGSGKALYRWDEVSETWALLFKSNVDTLTFTSESKTISADRVQLSQVPANGQIWDVYVRDGVTIHQVEYSVNGFTVTLNTDTVGQFDGLRLEVKYAYGSITGQLEALLNQKSELGHGHGIADVLGLSEALEAKQPAGSYEAAGAAVSALESHVVAVDPHRQYVKGDDTRLGDARPASDVSAWAKAATKPSYTATEVGATPAEHTGATGAAHGTATASAAGFMSATDKTKLDGVATNANNYSHPTSDGNLHVPATGTTNSGKVLTAGATAGSLSWVAPLALGSTAGTALGTAAAGTATTAARSDHVHPVQTSVSGNAGTATKLETARTINGVSFDGSANITVNAVDSTAREPAIAAGTAAQYWRGDKSWRDLFTDVRAATLTGLSTATNAVVSATDTVLGALGKLQKQVSDNLTTLTSHTGSTSNPHSVTKAQVGLGNVDNTSDADKAVLSATKLATARTIAGASFDGQANIDISYTNLTNKPALGTAAAKDVPATGNAGNAQVVMGSDSRLSDARTPTAHSQPWSSITSTPTTLAGYGITDAADAAPVQSVAGKTGAVTLAKADVGLGNVDNTSDASKPISTAVQTALNAKQDTLVSGTNIKTLNGESLLGAGNIELQLAADQPSAVSYIYDTSGRVETTTETLPTGTRTTTVTYNEAGQVKTVTITLGTSTRTTQYAYDQYGVLTGTTSTES